MATATIVAVNRSARHSFSKTSEEGITLIEGIGVKGDAHAGETVKHLADMVRDPNRPNLRQVHLIQSELFAEMAEKGYQLAPGSMGENITTAGLDLLALPLGARLQLGETAVVELTGLRNPCAKINGLGKDLMKEMVARDAGGNLVRKTGVMSVVLFGGTVRAGDPIHIHMPEEDHIPLPVL
ncbi:MOSC domain-containing protein [Amorphus orientalis]|uniref:MOSC domain-containing protein YiiM n=1 Tax=Amorphus orientalis TaxID=649198 RepID=A0AAE3VNY9_9HYPH|nr:MOSC domain-containing protein [Amorphus orientalis]MDQ0316134.1 MOSC domain-containing protein YiiM [Amorphus orientalis]